MRQDVAPVEIPFVPTNSAFFGAGIEAHLSTLYASLDCFACKSMLVKQTFRIRACFPRVSTVRFVVQREPATTCRAAICRIPS
jgi:hypothetical protein